MDPHTHIHNHSVSNGTLGCLTMKPQIAYSDFNRSGCDDISYLFIETPLAYVFFIVLLVQIYIEIRTEIFLLIYFDALDKIA